MTDETDSGLFGDSRRSFMKKGALTAGALALGTAGAGTATAQADGEVVVFGDDYEPGADFTVASGLDDSTRDELFQETGAGDAFDSPQDWDVYIINYDMGGSAPSLGFLMTEEADLSAGDSGTMGSDGSFRNPELNLIEASLDGGGGGAETDAGNETETGGNGGGGGN